jgi:hypothetical protein
MNRFSDAINRVSTVVTITVEIVCFPCPENENWFSARLPHIGAKKKLVARILKSEPLILKSKPLIFRPLKTRSKNARKRRTNKEAEQRLPVCNEIASRNRTFREASRCVVLGFL